MPPDRRSACTSRGTTQASGLRTVGDVNRPIRHAASADVLGGTARTVGRGLVEVLIAADPQPAWQRRGLRWLANGATALGAVFVLLTLWGAMIALREVAPATQPPGVLIASELLAMLLLAVRYPLLAWRFGLLVSLTVPLIQGEPRIQAPDAVALVAVFCLGAMRHDRAVLWWMWALMVGGTWIWGRPSWERPAIISLCLTALAVALDSIAASRRARHDLAEQVERSDLEEARRAVLEERTRIAREMHDVVAHHMSMIAVQAETAPYRLGDLPESARAEFATLNASARAALADMRKLLRVLRSDEPASKTPQPRLSDLPELVQATRRAGVAVELSMRPPKGDVPSAVEVCAYRIVQEALSNARRHAGGSEVVVSIERDGDSLRLEVRNGRGSAAAPGPREGRAGLGLVGMRERVALIGGSLSAGPTELGGFLVAACLPLRDTLSVPEPQSLEDTGDQSDTTVEEHR
jgi:signal transduction histidine kinase